MQNKINPEISPRIIQSISSVYTDPVNVIMEYIDNCYDEAEKFFNQETNEYSRKVNLQINIEGKDPETAKLRIKDDCGGISDMSKIIKSIGSSSKKEQPFLNGKFGYGIYSFMAICEQIEIISRYKEKTECLIIRRQDFDKEKASDVELVIKEVDSEPAEDGTTTVILTEFDESKWKELNPDLIQEEIQKHFNHLLSRVNIVTDFSALRKKIRLLSFKYSDLEGNEFRKEIPIEDRVGRKNTIIGKAVLYLKFTPGRSLERPPDFISKGRSITEIRKLNLFDTHHKSDIWGHPNITGYIDTKDLLTPTISRNEYKNDSRLKNFFKKLRAIEPKILKFIQEETAEQTTDDYSSLEKILNSKISDLINSITKKEIKIGTPTPVSEEENEHRYVVLMDNNTATIKPATERTRVNQKKSSNKTVSKPKKESIEYLDPEELNTNALTLKIDSSSAPIRDQEGVPKRSEIFGTQVVIYKKHPDFTTRLDITRLGVEKITYSLFNYLLCEFFLHYVTVEESDKEINTKDQLIMFTNYIYTAEAQLKSYAGKNLNELTE